MFKIDSLGPMQNQALESGVTNEKYADETLALKESLKSSVSVHPTHSEHLTRKTC